MGVIHFLNVDEGDCTWIRHPSGHNTVIDISCAIRNEKLLEAYSERSGGNQQRKYYPVNPIEYLKNYDVEGIFRFILTHPDMDHMDGLKDFFDKYSIINFWDTANDKVMDTSSDWGKYSKDDWEFYQSVRKKVPIRKF